MIFECFSLEGKYPLCTDALNRVASGLAIIWREHLNKRVGQEYNPWALFVGVSII